MISFKSDDSSFYARFDDDAKLFEIGHAGGGLGVWFYGSERQDQDLTLYTDYEFWKPSEFISCHQIKGGSSLTRIWKIFSTQEAGNLYHGATGSDSDV